MRFKNEMIFFSPSDLITFLDSPFASHMERSFLEDKSQSVLLDPKDAMLMNLQKKGYEHESAFLSSLIADGKNVLEIENEQNEINWNTFSYREPLCFWTNKRLEHTERKKLFNRISERLGIK